MFYQQALKPKELLSVLPHVGECFFVIEGQLSDRFYKAAVYKYEKEFFLLTDDRLYSRAAVMKSAHQGDENQILPYIEEAMEDNFYFVVDEGFVLLDLATLSKLAETSATLEIQYYEFVD
ncbi:hypothetical protein [Enterococcus songbeiensis]|uniref:hypothetical protein n=1 Tax=Enterococcus songbeiensis TaxID=2559927 RepID=UPI0010FA049A|nr:hypothetical protein [Enterococcus songbeiensis]